MSDTLNQRWAATLVGALVASGVRHAVIAPGSRSTPLALAFADRSDVRSWPVIDERSAAFFALGLSKESGTPAAVVCTSGTAGAHFLPAVIEASEGRTPLVVLTADRPWELHGFGAPQTVEQSSLFAGFSRAISLLPAPEDRPAMFTHLAAVVNAACQRAIGSSRGPVHFNVPFREPLEPETSSAGPVVNPVVAQHRVSAGAPSLADVEAAIARSQRGVIVCGPRDRNDGFGAAVHRLGAVIGFPVIAEAASNARFGFPEAITAAEAIVSSERLAKELAPDLVLRFGGVLSSKPLQRWIDAAPGPMVLFSEDELQVDAAHKSSVVVHGPATAACEALSALPPRNQASRERYLRLNAAAEAVLTHQVPAMSEPGAARALVAALPDGASLITSSSMPIRELDRFAVRPRGALRVFANRGVNGIDGMTSTALGVSASGRRPTALLIGDVATLHDLSGWLIARQHRLDLTVVVLNNDGGGIFDFLPIAQRTQHFESLFAMPHGVDLAHVAALGGATLHRPTDVAGLRQALAAGLERGLHLIEVRTSRSENVTLQRALIAQMTAAVEAA